MHFQASELGKEPNDELLDCLQQLPEMRLPTSVQATHDKTQQMPNWCGIHATLDVGHDPIL